jgi:hypothetical protein
MEHSQKALDLLEDSLDDDFWTGQELDPEINVVQLEMVLRQYGFPGLVDLATVRYAVKNSDDRTTRIGIVTDKFFYEIDADNLLMRTAMVGRWPLVMDQATFDLYRHHSKNPSQVITWPAGVTHFELTKVSYDVLRWEIPELGGRGHNVQLRRSADIHKSPTTIYIGDPVPNEEEE